MPSDSPAPSRRAVLKTLGLGAVALAGGALVSRAQTPAPGAAPQPAAAPLVPATPNGPYVLPPLPYAPEALEPHIDAETMRIHHGKHHQAYITSTNKALAGLPEFAALSPGELLTRLPKLSLPAPLATTLRNHVGGHHNHSLFWRTLRPAGTGKPASEALSAAIQKDLGGMDALKASLAEAAMKRFGSGWAWLSRRPDASLVVHSTANQDSPLLEGLTPLFGIDVWEHAYYLHYQNRRADYVAAIWNLVDWEAVSGNYEAS